jgi:hypothetical protein
MIQTIRILIVCMRMLEVGQQLTWLSQVSRFPLNRHQSSRSRASRSFAFTSHRLLNRTKAVVLRLEPFRYPFCFSLDFLDYDYEYMIMVSIHSL